MSSSFPPRVAALFMPTFDATTGSPPMIGRKLSIPLWLRYVSSYEFGSLSPTLIVLHHTWKPTPDTWRGIQSMRAMQTYYRSRGWSAAPHIYVAPDGIWLFTPMHTRGVHAGMGNGGDGWYSIGVEMVGDFDSAPPSGYVWDATKAVLGGLCQRIGLPPRRSIVFHRDYSMKSCPGHSVSKEWVWDEVDAWLREGNHDYWRALWGDSAPYNHDWGIPTAWRKDAERLGAARSGEVWSEDGAVQWFEGGCILYRAATNETLVVFF